MDPNAVNWNITIDDFDSLLTYKDQAQWTTPDPSASNYSTAGPWLRGTYHKTETKGASVSLNITGPALYVYGTMGPDYGSFEVDVDSLVFKSSAYQEKADNTTRLLFSLGNLTYATHHVVLQNLGALEGDKGGNAFALDYLQSTIQVAPTGATVTNVTYEETDPAINYSGTWGSNKSPFFSGGGSTYTNDDGASFSFSFHGSAIYVLGDKKNDHGLYSVVLDGQAPQSFNGVSGCGGAFGLTCEQQIPTIKYLASNLDDSLHTITLTNNAGTQKSFFDLDSIVVAVPSTYAPRQLSNATSPFVTTSGLPQSSTVSLGASNPSTTGTSSASPTNTTISSPTNTTSNASLPAASNLLLVFVLSFMFIMRGSVTRRL